MLRLVRYNPVSKPIGTIVEVFKSQGNNARIGEVAEITDPDGNPLNIAKVIDIYEKDTDEYMSLKMIA